MGYASFPKTAAPTRVRWRCGSVRFSPRRVRGTGTFDRDAADRRSRRIHRSPAERKTRPIERARTRRAAGLGVRKTPVLPEVMRFPDRFPDSLHGRAMATAVVGGVGALVGGLSFGVTLGQSALCRDDCARARRAVIKRPGLRTPRAPARRGTSRTCVSRGSEPLSGTANGSGRPRMRARGSG